MVGRVLNQHPNVRTFPEIHFFEQMCELRSLTHELSMDGARALMDRLIGTMEEGFLHYGRGGRYQAKAAEWLREMSGPLTPREIFQTFFERYTRMAGASVACDQTPRNVLYIGQILDAYPDARVIAMVRDPRSVLLSQKKKWKRKSLGASQIPLLESVRSYFNYHPYTITQLWSAGLGVIERNKNDPRVMVVQYEEIVTKPQETISRICSFLGLPYAEEMLEVPYVGSSSGHDDRNASLGLTTDSIRTSFDGVLTTGERYICEKFAKPYMQKYGYPPSKFSRLPIIQLFSYALMFPVKMSIALLFNVKRMKDIRESIMRRFSTA